MARIDSVADTRRADPREAAASLVKEMGIDAAEIALRLKAVDLTDTDREHLRGLRAFFARMADEGADAFVRYLVEAPELRAVVGDGRALDEVRALKRAHLVALGAADLDAAYVAQRVELAYRYGALGLETKWFLGAYHRVVLLLGDALLAREGADPARSWRCYQSVQKATSFDVALMTDTLIVQRERTIQRQQQAILELSTPVLQVRPGLLVLPVIGVIDAARAWQLTEQLLHAIRASRARVAVLDITGVAGLDSKAANHIVQTVEAARLMGAATVISGVSPEVAQTLVTLGVDLRRVATVGDLQRGLEEGDRLLGYRLVAAGDTPGEARS